MHAISAHHEDTKVHEDHEKNLVQNVLRDDMDAAGELYPDLARYL